MKVLLEYGARLNATTEEKDLGPPPLHRWAHTGGELKALFLVGAGNNTETGTLGGNYPINLAAASGNLESTKYLLEKGADLHASGAHQWTPLHHTAGNGRNLVLDFLIKRGAVLESTNDDGETPLHVAVRFHKRAGTASNLDTVRHLLDAGANIDASTNEQYRPLHFGAENGDTRMVRLLLERGADRSAETSKQDTPLALAVKKGNIKVVELLM
jgi:ankyrin repeat protein